MAQQAIGEAAMQVEGALAGGERAGPRMVAAGADHRSDDLGGHLALRHAGAGGSRCSAHPGLGRAGGLALIRDLRRRFPEAQLRDETVRILKPQFRQRRMTRGGELPGIQLRQHARAAPEPQPQEGRCGGHPVLAVGPSAVVAEDAGAIEVVARDVATEDGWLAFGRHQRKLQRGIAAGEEAGQPGDGFRLEGQQRIGAAGAQRRLHAR